METLSPTTQILLVEDDTPLAELISEYLSGYGYNVVVESNGDRALDRILEESPQLVILDIMLPGIDGFTVCRRIRGKYHGPVLMLTARGEDADELIGFESGADDYLRKPVRPKVLLARVEALLRRVQREKTTDTALASSANKERIECGRLLVDKAQRSVQFDNKTVELTTAEFDLLWLLATKRGQPLSREQIYYELRGLEYNGIDRSIDLRVSRLRKKLGDDGEAPGIIKSIRGVGYLLVERP